MSKRGRKESPEKARYLSSGFIYEIKDGIGEKKHSGVFLTFPPPNARINTMDNRNFDHSGLSDGVPKA